MLIDDEMLKSDGGRAPNAAGFECRLRAGRYDHSASGLSKQVLEGDPTRHRSGSAPGYRGLADRIGRHVAEGSLDAIWSSHSLEHLHTHEVIPALAEFRRALRRDGFALITCPDLTAVVRFMLEKGVEAVAYHSGVGPIRPLDMIYGHAKSVADGRLFMAHNTGFTSDRLGRVAVEAGFAQVRVVEGPAFALWAALIMPEADEAELASLFRHSHIEALFGAGSLPET